MNWNQIKYFNKKEFHGCADLLEDQVIHNLDKLRVLLKERIYPSPVKGAISRFGGSKTSQHYVGIPGEPAIRKSTAIDVFIEGIPFLNFSDIINTKLFSGIGIYMDTNGPDGLPWIMFHVDLRESYRVGNPLVWICTKDISGDNKYYYPDSDSSHWKLLMKRAFFTERVK